MPVKVDVSRPEHQDCHRRAAKVLREAAKADGKLAWRFGLGKEDERRKAILKEQEALRMRLEQLDEEAVLVEVRMRALHSGDPTTTGHCNGTGQCNSQPGGSVAAGIAASEQVEDREIGSPEMAQSQFRSANRR